MHRVTEKNLCSLAKGKIIVSSLFGRVFGRVFGFCGSWTFLGHFAEDV